MDNQHVKIQRSVKLIKYFMALIVLAFAVQFYQSQVFDFGAVAGVIGTLAMLRALLASPTILAMPIKVWLKSEHKLSKESYFYFLLALILFIISSF